MAAASTPRRGGRELGLERVAGHGRAVRAAARRGAQQASSSVSAAITAGGHLDAGASACGVAAAGWPPAAAARASCSR